MSKVSAGQAIGAGFRLIRRSPLLIPAWALAGLLLLLPQFAFLAAAAPRMIAYYQLLARASQAGGSPDPAQMFAFQQQMMAFQGVSWISSVLFHSVLLGAIFRAVLLPEEGRWAYLRLGARELWLGLASVVLMILWILMIVAVMIPFGVAIGVMAAVASHAGAAAGGGLVLGAALIVALAALLWVILRLSFALPMAFAERRFVLFEAWTLTRGNSLSIILVALGVLAIFWILEMIFIAAFWLAVVSFGHLDLTSFAALPAAEVMRRVLPAMLLLAPVSMLVAIAALTIAAAPWAEIYRQLRAEPAA